MESRNVSLLLLLAGSSEIMPRWFMWYRRPYNLICKQHQVDAEIFIMAYHCTAAADQADAHCRTDGWSDERMCSANTRTDERGMKLRACRQPL
jgi:hypothetical protein